MTQGNEWDALEFWAIQNAGARKLSDFLFECHGLHFCANRTISMPTLSPNGHIIGKRTIAKDRSPRQMFLLIKLLIERDEKELANENQKA